MNEKQLETIKDCFRKCEYLQNKKIVLKNKEETTTLLLLAKDVDVIVPRRLIGWIKQNLNGFWGNQRVKCNGRSDKIFEILNLIMEKLN